MRDWKQKHYKIYGTPCHATHAMGRHSVKQTRHKIWNMERRLDKNTSRYDTTLMTLSRHTFNVKNSK
jgi:hypothetical protein